MLYGSLVNLRNLIKQTRSAFSVPPDGSPASGRKKKKGSGVGGGGGSILDMEVRNLGISCNGEEQTNMQVALVRNAV